MSACPCCGSIIDDPVPEQLRHVPLPNRQRTILHYLLDKFPSPALTDAIVDHVYRLDRNGGPDNPKNNLGVHIFNINRRLAGQGWRIASLDQNSRVLKRIAANG